MKISYRTHPVLKKLEDQKLGVIGFYPEDKDISTEPSLIRILKENFHTFSPFYKQHIRHISKPFSEAIIKSFNSLIRDDVWDNMGEEYGTILNMNTPFGYISAMYYIRGEPNNESHTSAIYYFSGNTFLGIATNSPSNDESFALLSNRLTSYFKENFSKLSPFETTAKDLITSDCDNLLYSYVIAHINFIKYAQVETKELKAGQKLKGIDCNYKNETKSNVTHLDCTWFTNLIKSDAFDVRGHFRLQACGEGMKDRKMIWIKPFVKSGYTAFARKLKEAFT